MYEGGREGGQQWKAGKPLIKIPNGCPLFVSSPFGGIEGLKFWVYGLGHCNTSLDPVRD